MRAVAIGSGILGTGGGGNPYLGRVWVERVMKDLNTGPRIIDVEDVPDDSFVCAVSGMGAPTVGVEKLSETREFTSVIQAMEEYVGKKMAALSAVRLAATKLAVDVIGLEEFRKKLVLPSTMPPRKPENP